MSVIVRSAPLRLTSIELVGKPLMREIGLLARERILRRTTAGQDATGAPFQPYSPAYAERKGKELGGSGVNLQVSGGMLRNLQIVDLTDNRVTLGWNT